MSETTNPRAATMLAAGQIVAAMVAKGDAPAGEVEEWTFRVARALQAGAFSKVDFSKYQEAFGELKER